MGTKNVDLFKISMNPLTGGVQVACSPQILEGMTANEFQSIMNDHWIKGTITEIVDALVVKINSKIEKENKKALKELRNRPKREVPPEKLANAKTMMAYDAKIRAEKETISINDKVLEGAKLVSSTINVPGTNASIDRNKVVVSGTKLSGPTAHVNVPIELSEAINDHINESIMKSITNGLSKGGGGIR